MDVLAHFDKLSLNRDFVGDEMLPAVPLGLKADGQHNGIESDFQLEAAVAIDSPIGQVVQLTKRDCEVPALDGWNEGENPADEEAAIGRCSRYQDEPETAEGKQSRSFRIGQQRILAGSQLRHGQEVHGPCQSEVG